MIYRSPQVKELQLAIKLLSYDIGPDRAAMAYRARRGCTWDSAKLIVASALVYIANHQDLITFERTGK